MIIDSHLHVWELSSAQYPWNPLASIVPDYAWPIEKEVEVMDRYGIDKGLLVQPSMYRWDNRYLLECARRFPDRFRLVGLVNPQSPRVLEDMETLASQEVNGLRLSPMLRPDMDWYNTPESDRVWVKAGELGLIITLLVFPNQVGQAREAIQRFPQTHVVVDHLARPDNAAAPHDMDDLFSLEKFEQVYVKVSALGFMARQPGPHLDVLSVLRRAYDCFGPQRLMWGTDTPMSTKPIEIPAALELIDQALPSASQEDLGWIKGGTAEKLFGWA